MPLFSLYPKNGRGPEGIGGTVHRAGPTYSPVITPEIHRASAPHLPPASPASIGADSSPSADIGPGGGGPCMFRRDTETSGGGVGDKAAPKTPTVALAMRRDVSGTHRDVWPHLGDGVNVYTGPLGI